MPRPASVDRLIAKCKSWEDIQRTCQSLSDKQKGDLFEHLVKAYLLLEPEYASELKHVWLHQEVPLELLKKLKLPATDQGIDIVAETYNGEFWGIQCKYRHLTDQSLTWREVSTFTGLIGMCQGITFGLICSTTERLTRVLKDHEKIGLCALDIWQGLDADFFTRLRAHLAHKPVKLKPIRPRPHQKSAVKDGVAHFVRDKATRGKLIMPCGSGKSLTAYWLANALDARRIVIAVPSLSLIRQTLKVWLREAVASQHDVRWICVCSDESAARIERDDVAVLSQDIGVPCLTDPTKIASWLKQKHDGLTVVFTTYQSGEAISTAARSAKFRFDLGIMDEAHKTVGAKDKLFSHLLHDENLPIAQRIFMTATERRYAGQSDSVLSMENPDVYGETFHLLSFKRALEYDPPILSDYKIISISVSRDEVAELIRNNVFVKPDKGRWNDEIEADMLASLVALRKAMTKYPIRHAVSFHSSIQRAELFKNHNDVFSQAFPDYGNLETFHVSGKTPTGTRARVIGEFANTQRALITNARCLTEGVDVPGIDCVLFADPRRSAVDIVQAVGRALRPAPGKKLGYVIVPILHDANSTPNDIFESESFQEILTTLRALAANDDRIIEYFRAVSQGRQHTVGGSVDFEMDARLTQRIDLSQFVHEIELKCWDRLAKLSWRTFQEARSFAHSLGIKGVSEWSEFCKGNLPEKGKRPEDIPATPQSTYANKGWMNWGDWLGTGNVADHLRQYRSFNKARAFARSLGLKTGSEWNAFCKGNLPEKGTLPPDISASPQNTYTDKGWAGMGDWLGTGFISTHRRKHRSFSDARKFAQSLSLGSAKEWSQTSKSGVLPKDIPVKPNKVYKGKGWVNWGDWLGTGIVAARLRKYRSFTEARTFARSLNLKDGDEWREFSKSGKLPEDIPLAPGHTYKDNGWAGMGDWLGTGTIAARFREYRSFEDARDFARSLKLQNGKQWFAFTKSGKLPKDIPANPKVVYKDIGWIAMGDWLGTGTVAARLRKYRSFTEARDFARSLMLQNGKQWRELSKSGKLPEDVPANPRGVYKDKGWIDEGDWLGTGTIAVYKRKFMPFNEARKFAQSLKLKSQSQWFALAKSERLPKNIPTSPSSVYKHLGWLSWGDWLGTKPQR